MTINDILYLDIPANFGTDENYEITGEISYVMDQLDDTVKTAWGVSQFVIISNDWEEVIKIPFAGGYFYYDDDDEDADFEEWNKDYCQYSLDLYNKACTEKIDPIFAKMRFVGTAINGAKIYAQEKIMIDHASSKIEYSEDSLNKVKNKQKNRVAGWGRFKRCWLAAAIDCYGEEVVNNFIKFCYDNDISDTHEYNYGYRKDGSPVIFDYGSFDE
jgi:hypothetical protein